MATTLRDELIGAAAAPELLLPPVQARVAYFSMEIALDERIPTYSGGLGILAGDTIRSAADLGVPMVAVTLLHRKGYFKQKLDEHGNQTEGPVDWEPAELLEELQPIASLSIEGREVRVRCWRYLVHGVNGHIVPVYFLGTDIEPNDPQDRVLTDHLYGGDQRYRLCQEFLLGTGGIAMLEQLGHSDVETFHMNEGHSALLTLALLERQIAAEGDSTPEMKIDAIRRQCVFTTHTPVPAGHDAFANWLVHQVLGGERANLLFSTKFTPGDELNMTHLALHFSNYVNGVAMRHGTVSRGMFPKYRIKALTNGVHAATWATPSIRALFDRELPEWRHDNIYLRYAIDIPLEEVAAAHTAAKKALFARIKSETGLAFNPQVFTIGFARRATGYKRADLFLTYPERLKKIAAEVGPMQVVYGGKAHPQDEGGKELIRRVFAAREVLGDKVKLVYVENYNMPWGLLICGGVDLWLNTPIQTREASGTSGMKAALNGIPSLSVLDGWWIEGHVEGVTGWSIVGAEDGRDAEVHSLYDKLEKTIVPMYYNDPAAYTSVMRSAIALNGSFFNTQRMVLQYVFNAYSVNARR
jgi:starch phosphorylase